MVATVTDKGQREFEAWARLAILNLNLEKYPPLQGQVGGRLRYRDPTTEVACAAWYAGHTAALSRPKT